MDLDKSRILSEEIALLNKIVRRFYNIETMLITSCNCILSNIEVELEGLALEGELFKKENNSSKWNKKYFQLIPQSVELVYYKSKEVRNTLRSNANFPRISKRRKEPLLFLSLG
jgi:hypothetical protein